MSLKHYPLSSWNLHYRKLQHRDRIRDCISYSSLSSVLALRPEYESQGKRPMRLIAPVPFFYLGRGTMFLFHAGPAEMQDAGYRVQIGYFPASRINRPVFSWTSNVSFSACQRIFVPAKSI